MLTDEFDYDLPPERIALVGAEPRDSARLLVVNSTGNEIVLDDRRVSDLADLLEPGDVLVVNDTRVLPARVRFTRDTGGSGEVLLLDEVDGDGGDDGGDDGDGDGDNDNDGSGTGWWRALVRPSAKLRPGSTVQVADSFGFEFGGDLGDGVRRVRPTIGGAPAGGAALLDALDRHGEMPLPPYLGSAHLDDPDRYQTVFSQRPASAAAPTAGLHLTPGLLDRIRGRGVEVVTVELVVGLGTFRPMTTDRVEDHEMHHESYRVSDEAWSAITAAKDQGGRVVAVGTTVVRALEAAAASGELVASTGLFIRSGYPWQVVDVLMTNFHLPRSTLLVMIDAFVGPVWRHVYEVAAQRSYRFLSLGDAMLLTREVPT